MNFQTRSENTGLNYFNSLNLALDHADKDKSVWKISFLIKETQENVRLVKTENVGWVLETIFPKQVLEN